MPPFGLDLGPLLLPNLGRLGGRMGPRTPPFLPGRPGAQRTNPGAVSGAPPTQQTSTRDTMQDGVPPVGTAPAVNSSAQSPDYDDMGNEVQSNNTPRMPSLLHQDQRTEASRSLPTAPSLLQAGASSAAANARDQRLLEVMDNPPQPRGGVAGKLGGFFNALGWNQIGDPLKNPGLPQWQADLARAQQQADIANRAALRDQSIANQQSQRQESDARIQDNRAATFTRNMDAVTRAGGFEADTVPPSTDTYTVPADPNQPVNVYNMPISKRLLSPGLQPQQSSGLGTLQKLTDPTTGETRNMVWPNAAVQQEMKDAANPMMTDKLADFAGVPRGTRVPKDIYNQYLRNMQAANKPKPPSAAEAQDQFQATMAKLASTLPPGAITDVNQQVQAIRGGVAKGIITADEANNAIAFLTTRPTPATTGTTGVQRMGALARSRMYSVLDTQNGNAPIMVSAADIAAEPDRYLSAGAGGKALQQTNFLEDVRGSITNARQALKGMPDLGASDKLLIAGALKDPKPSSALSLLFRSGSLSGAVANNPQLQNLLIQLAQLRENAMSLRTATGQGQGSQQQREAIWQTLPTGLEPNNAYMSQQLDAAEAMIDRITRGVPKVPLRPPQGGPAASPPPAKGGRPPLSQFRPR